MSNPRSLLVIDDSEADGEPVSLALDAAFPGANIRRGANPLLAKQMCQEQDFDCVLLDYNMPLMDGLTLAGELRAAFAYLPIILLTSFGDEMLAAKALRGGVSDYLPKSRISGHSMRRTIDRAIQTCRQARVIDDQRAELETFAYALAHDFKQPIRQIMTFSQLVSDAIPAGESDDIRRHLGFLSTAANRLGKLVDVMSQYTLLNQAPKLSDVDLKTILRDVEAALTPFLYERGGELSSPLAAPRVHANETLMTQVLQNLIINGLLYNRSSSPRVEVTIESHPDHCIVEVRDNGIGIAAEYLSDIFKPLVRLHAASEFPGTGLGLPLARKAVIAQHGAIWCESVVSQGSVFHIRLPVARGGRRKKESRETPIAA